MRVPWAGGEWRRVAVYGLGLSGSAALGLLRRRGVAVVAVDDRAPSAFAEGVLEPLADDPGVELRLAADAADGEAVADAVDGVITSPGVPPDRPLLAAARARGLAVIAEVELAFELLDPERDTVIAITGSNGKSTTTAMTGAVLEAGGRRTVVCGNIGTPLAARVDDVPDDVDERTLVVELSSFQLEGIDRFRPRAAALINLSPDHIDRHGSLERYRAAKAAIFRNQTADDVAVLNADDPRVADLPSRGRRRFFSRRGPVADGCYLDRDRVLETAPGDEPIELFATADVAVEGLHNLENAMASALLARSRSVAPAAIASGLRGYVGLPHRLERVTERAGVIWYDDSKGTNLGATEASLRGFADGRVHIILGGRGKGTDFDTLVPIVARKARAAYLIGESAAALDAALSAGAPAVERVIAGTLDRAVARAADAARPGEVVLLSPACASFDQFDNFMQRGRVFQRLVAELEPPVGVGRGGRDGA